MSGPDAVPHGGSGGKNDTTSTIPRAQYSFSEQRPPAPENDQQPVVAHVQGPSTTGVHAPSAASSGVQALEHKSQETHSAAKYISGFSQQCSAAHSKFNQSQLAVHHSLDIDRMHQYRQFAAEWLVDMPLHRWEQATQFDKRRIHADTEVAQRCGLSLAEFVQVYRGQTPSDPRPNKDIFELPTPADPGLRQLTQRWNTVVRDGVVPLWKPDKPQLQADPPPNHKVVELHADQVREHIAKGHQDGRYLIVHADLLKLWSNIFTSPIGVVQKPGSSTSIRVINDYSCPVGGVVNDFTERSNFPEISYNPPGDIARRIADLRARYPGHPILMMLGDVSGAFRHIPMSARHVHMFAFHFEGFLVVDLSCGFGWCGSPAFYSLAGSLINQLYQQQRPHRAFAPADPSPLVGNVWCDDHTCVEIDTGTRCLEANFALRRAMATVLRPTAINKDKFTDWVTSTKALGLLWDTTTGTVSVTADKIGKARLRIQQV